jgi:hypothetical protein
MAFELASPDLEIAMFPDLCAPRAARYCVGTIERPAPELREAVVLLTSELVSRAVRLHSDSSNELFELRVWMRDDAARVELRGAHELVCARSPRDAHGDEPHEEDLRLFDALADRWSIDVDERGASIWFEIDRDQHRNQRWAPLGSIHLPRRRDSVRATAERWAGRWRGGVPARHTSVSARRGEGSYGACHTR